jgi:diguanylate cyclase (GGDEF)-like protein
MLLTAVDGRPDLASRRPTLPVGGRYRLPGLVVFGAGLFLYFVLIPAHLSPELYSSMSPSFFLYIALDVYLVARLLVLAGLTDSARWRRCFHLTAAMAVMFLVSDVAELLVMRDVLPFDAGMPWQALWLLPGVGVVVAVRLRALPVAEEAQLAGPAKADPGSKARGAPFFAYALIFPLIHFAFYRVGLFQEVTRPVHENFVLLWMVCLGAISLAQHLELERKNLLLVDERRLTEEKLWYLANFDPLTGLPNRVLFRDRLAQALKTARRDGRLVALVFSDLDDFKRVNDSYGHAVGDELLQCVAERLQVCLRESDTVARLGGDEFIVVLEAIEDSGHVERLTQRIAVALSQPYEVGGQIINLGTSLGVGFYPRDGEDVDTLLANADSAMYEGKRGKQFGGSNVRFFSEAVHGKVRDRLRRENDLRRALEREELVLHYQPKWSVANGQLTGFEALIRWHHPECGLLLPLDFVPTAERVGLIEAIGSWVLETACTQLEEWRRMGFDEIRVAANLAAGQFRDPDLARRIGGLLAARDLVPSSLELEVTETMVLSDVESAASTCRELAAIGVEIAIDDFGSGHSSLRYLTLLSPARIKVDRSFISEVATNPRGGAVVVGMISMAHQLDLEVVAEGVETEEERAFVESHGCDEVQGFLYGRPEPAVAATRLLERTRRRRRRFSTVGRSGPRPLPG